MGMFTLRESGRARTHRTSSPASQRIRRTAEAVAGIHWCSIGWRTARSFPQPCWR